MRDRRRRTTRRRRPPSSRRCWTRCWTLPTLRDLADYDGSYRAQAAAKRATSELTGRFAGAAVVGDPRRSRRPGRCPATTPTWSCPARVAAECALLKAVAVRYVMRRPGIAERQAAQRRLLTELVEAVADGAPAPWTAACAPTWHEAGTDADRLRVVVDQVAQLTDSSAVARHARLVGPR